MLRRHEGSRRKAALVLFRECLAFHLLGKEAGRPYCPLPSVLMLRSVSAVVTLGILATISTFP